MQNYAKFKYYSAIFHSLCIVPHIHYNTNHLSGECPRPIQFTSTNATFLSPVPCIWRYIFALFSRHNHCCPEGEVLLRPEAMQKKKAMSRLANLLL